MEGNERLYPISEEIFNRKVLPVIEGDYIWKGRPPKVSHYQAFCGILYIGLVQQPGWLSHKPRRFAEFFAKIRQICCFLAEVVQ
jgi:hypothetical protein